MRNPASTALQAASETKEGHDLRLEFWECAPSFSCEISPFSNTVYTLPPLSLSHPIERKSEGAREV